MNKVMPIMLDDVSSVVQSVKRTNTPHFFSKELTGQGKSRGLINEHTKPGRYPANQSRSSMDISVVDIKHKASSGSITLFTIPMAPLRTSSTTSLQLNGQAELEVPATSEMFHVTEAATVYPFDVYVDLTPQGARITEDGTDDTTIRTLDVLYRMEVYVLAKGSTSQKVRLRSLAPSGSSQFTDEYVLTDFSYAPLDDIRELITNATWRYTSPKRPDGVYVDEDALAEWMQDYDLYDRICRQADVWTGNKISETINDLIEQAARYTSGADLASLLAPQMRYLENYSVPLEGYREIYQALKQHCSEDIVEFLTKQNLNLLMNDTLATLDDLKPQLVVPPVNQQAIASLPAKFSTQQKNAITTTEPLSLTTAGAGTGKSTTILERINYLTGSGIAPQEITVLSFTNAAADNILLKNPAVGSMTIARMVMDIYQLNHPTHQTSTIETIVNSLDIFYPNNDTAAIFRGLLINMDRNRDGAMTALNAFVEKRFDEVLGILNRIRQTCLELQIIIAYQQIDTMVEPPHLAGQYLIVDEVQDNSLFEFIYLLRYVIKHKQNMFIVGDASQTLYEFRSANPKALNALEGSGVFTCYKLTTNYRSNQEILDFANVHLADIEANALSQIRLQANSLAMPTKKSFTERVHLEYKMAKTKREFNEDFAGYMTNIVKPYVDKCLARGEKVAFLAFKKRDGVDAFERELKRLYPNEEIANITSKRSSATTIFSKYVKAYWNDVKQVQPGDAAFVVSQGVVSNLTAIAGRNAKTLAQFAPKLVSDWWLSESADINSWVAQYKAGQITRDEFFDRLMHNILEYEIKLNGIKQLVLNQKNRDNKERNAQGNANLIVSTIHGAKGLEFDNVVVLHHYDTQLPEDQKRMYYVALTRAMNTELILSTGSQRNPRIVSDYELLTLELEKRDQRETLRKQGINVDTLSDDEIEDALAVYTDTNNDSEESTHDKSLENATS